MGLYDVPMFMSLFGFGIGMMFASFHVSAGRMMFVKMVFAVCMSGGGRMSEKAASVSVVNCVQFAFL